jgi:dCMP deaminase
MHIFLKVEYMLQLIANYKKLQSNTKEQIIRLDWDEYFMSIALLASQRSPCERLNVGSVIVKNNRLISMGYNGYIPGAPHISRVHDNHEQSIIHSEINALSDCAKRGVSLEGSKIYVTHYPCINCFRSIAACGIKEVIFLEDYNNNPIVEELANDSSILIKKLITIQ